jgi:hypothetical protein
VLRGVNHDEKSNFTEMITNKFDAVLRSPFGLLQGLDKQKTEALSGLFTDYIDETIDSETVGGSVDAALITKGDAFIRIKKKTNYDPVLNRHLNQSYFYGGKNEILF